jgi:CRP/FNR family transcriptional regulator
VPATALQTVIPSGALFTSSYAIRLRPSSPRLTRDGREQLLGYRTGGEIAGLAIIAMPDDVIVLEDSEVCVFPFDELDRLACDVPSLRRDLFRFISSDIAVQLRD